MKRIVLILPIIVLIMLCFIACGAKTILSEATGATFLQSNKINRWLSSVDIVCNSIDISNNPLAEDINEGWKAYDLIGEDGNTYFLILRKEDNDFTAILDNNGILLTGMIDNAVLPAFYE